MTTPSVAAAPEDHLSPLLGSPARQLDFSPPSSGLPALPESPTARPEVMEIGTPADARRILQLERSMTMLMSKLEMVMIQLDRISKGPTTGEQSRKTPIRHASQVKP